MKKFTHLHVPETWRHYWSKYPEGYTVLESLMSWVSQVDEMVDSQNNLSELVNIMDKKITDFIRQFDTDLQQQVEEILTDWQNSGFLEIVMSEVVEHKLIEQMKDTHKGMNYNRKTPLLMRNKVNPTLVIFDDDTSSQAYSIMYKEFVQGRDIPMSFALISSRVGQSSGSLSMAEFNEMKEDDRVEFTNHTENHPHLGALSDSEIESEIANCERWLNDHGIFTNTLVPPFGSVGERVRDIALKYCDSVLVTDSMVNDINDKLLMTEKVVRVEFSRPFNDITPIIDEGANVSGLVVLSCHSHYSQNTNNNLNFSPQKLHDVIDYAISKGYEIMKWTDAFERFKNPIEYFTGDRTKIGVNALGQSISFGTLDTIDSSSEVFQDVHIDSPPSFYPPSKLTKQYLYESKAIERGFPRAGTLITNRENNDAYTTQLFMGARSRVLLYRYWANDDRWTQWYDLINANLELFDLPNTKPTATTPPGSYPALTTTYYQINTADANSDGWPSAGILKMVNPPSVAYAYQEFRPYRSNSLLSRYYNSVTNEWTNFE